MLCRKSFFVLFIVRWDSNPHIILISVRQPEGARGFESFSRCHVVASFIALAPTFFQKSERAHAAAPPFQIEPAAQPLAASPPYGCGVPLAGTALGFDLVAVLI